MINHFEQACNLALNSCDINPASLQLLFADQDINHYQFFSDEDKEFYNSPDRGSHFFDVVLYPDGTPEAFRKQFNIGTPNEIDVVDLWNSDGHYTYSARAHRSPKWQFWKGPQFELEYELDRLTPSERIEVIGLPKKPAVLVRRKHPNSDYLYLLDSFSDSSYRKRETPEEKGQIEGYKEPFLPFLTNIWVTVSRTKPSPAMPETINLRHEIGYVIEEIRLPFYGQELREAINSPDLFVWTNLHRNFPIPVTTQLRQQPQ